MASGLRDRISTGFAREFRRSAEPDVEVAARLPCLQTRTWGARSRADVVDTLKVLWPSPPVPTMSTYNPFSCCFPIFWLASFWKERSIAEKKKRCNAAY